LDNNKGDKMPKRGYKQTKEHIKKSSEARTGIKRKPLSEEHKMKLSNLHKGKPLSEEHRIKISLGQKGRIGLKGDKNPFWKGGVSSLKNLIRSSVKYKEWRSKVFERDNWTCQTCKTRGNIDIEAHHRKSFNKLLREFNIKTTEESDNCKELWDIDNGVTLCEDCHNLTKDGRGL
jgi:hypothetical protein